MHGCQGMLGRPYIDLTPPPSSSLYLPSAVIHSHFYSKTPPPNEHHSQSLPLSPFSSSIVLRIVEQPTRFQQVGVVPIRYHLPHECPVRNACVYLYTCIVESLVYNFFLIIFLGESMKRYFTMILPLVLEISTEDY